MSVAHATRVVPLCIFVRQSSRRLMKARARVGCFVFRPTCNTKEEKSRRLSIVLDVDFTTGDEMGRDLPDTFSHPFPESCLRFFKKEFVVFFLSSPKGEHPSNTHYRILSLGARLAFLWRRCRFTLGLGGFGRRFAFWRRPLADLHLLDHLRHLVAV